VRILPSNPFLFYFRSPRKTLPIIGMLALSVFLMNVVVIYMNSFEATSQAHNSLVSRFSVLLPKKGRALDANVIEIAQSAPGVEWSLPVVSVTTHVPQAAGYTSFNILGLRDMDMTVILGAASAKLVVGRLPNKGAAEVALDERVLRAKKLKVGDKFGNDLDDSEVVQGAFTIVGALQGPVALGLASYEYLSDSTIDHRLPEGLLIHFRAGSEGGVNAALKALESDAVQLWNWPKLKQAMDEFMGQVRFIAVTLDVLLLCTLAAAVGLIQYIFALQRLHEFAIMMALGFTRSRIVGKLLAGNLLVMGVGWLGGIGLSIGTAIVLSNTLFYARGLSLGSMAAGIPWTLPMPVVVTLAGTATLAWELRKLDPVAILERRD
jgi:ABC-type lipoprotein release transport system permease subunit